MAWKQPLTQERTNKILIDLQKDIPMKYIATNNHVCVQTVREIFWRNKRAGKL